MLALVTGKNSHNTPVDVIADQLTTPRPLPTGMQEFEEWSDRIISGTLLTADAESMKFALANLILHLGPTESHKPDGYFIHSLRKYACNQIADAKRQEISAKAKARLAAEEAAKIEEQAQKDASTLAAVQESAESTLERATLQGINNKIQTEDAPNVQQPV